MHGLAFFNRFYSYKGRKGCANMFLEKLIISSASGVIREVKFKMGLNLIVDSTPELETLLPRTGNNVGKTTVLKLIDFCFGKAQSNIYRDEETNQDYVLVKDFLEQRNVVIELWLSSALDQENARRCIIRRNFLTGKKKILSVNGIDFTNVIEYSNEIRSVLFPNLTTEKPTLNQVIAHNFRYKDERINNTIKHLNQNTTNFEYESLFLYLLGMPTPDNKEQLKQLYNKENTYKSRLEQKQTFEGYKTMLSSTNNEIEKYEKIKSEFQLNVSYASDLSQLNDVKYKLNKVRSRIVNNKIRIELTEKTLGELSNSKSEIVYEDIKSLYEEATKLDPKINKKFEELLIFHNTMVKNKIEFFQNQLEISMIEDKELNDQLVRLLNTEKSLIDKTNKLFIEDDLESIIIKLNNLYNNKGEYETYVNQIEDAEKNIAKLAEQIDLINNDIQSDEFKKSLDKRRDKFNEFYNSISESLYKEKYYFKYDIKTDPRSKKDFYQFSTFNNNFGSGKKQGEIVSFDIAYILFARYYELPSLEFVCNDKKELMDINQIITVQEILNRHNIQFIFSILREKVSSLENIDDLSILELGQENKLFLIENQVTK